MYKILQLPAVARTLGKDTLAGLGSLVLAEFFYKFHSFTLELGGFLLTWYALSWLSQRVPRLVKAGSRTGQ